MLIWLSVKRPGFAVALLVCLFDGSGPGRAIAQTPDYAGKRIGEIYFEPAEQPLTRDQLGLALGFRPKDILTEDNLRRAIERLYASGRFADIAVEAHEAGGALNLTFKTRPHFFVSRVTVTGVPEPPNPAQLANATGLTLGSLFVDEQLEQATARLYDILRANGFYTARIRAETKRRGSTEEIDVEFVVDAGRRARFARPAFSGNLRLKEGRLIRATGWQRWFGLRGWKDVVDVRVQRGADQLRSLYLSRNYLMAQVRLNSLGYDPATNTVTPRLEIEAGSRVDVRLQGAKIGKSGLRRLLPIYQERTVDRELLLEGQRNIEAHFVAQGYFDVKVTHKVTAPDASGRQAIHYGVERGRRYKLAHLELRGNKYFSLEELRERMSVAPATAVRHRRGRYSRALLDRDIESIVALYRDNGFRDAAVKERIVPGWQGDPRKIALFLDIGEGPQWFVSRLDLSGVDLRLLGQVQPLLTSTPGQPFSAADVAADRDAVLNYYFDNGYPEAAIDVSMTQAEEPHRIELRYVVTEGRRNYVRDVLVGGLRTTNPSLVERRLAVAQNEPLSQAAIVESQRRLYDLGIFAKVDVAVQNPEGRERDKFVLMQVEEARRFSLNVGAGAEVGRIGAGDAAFDAPAGAPGLAPRVIFGLSRGNMFGAGHTAGVMLRASNIQQRVLLSYLAPQFRGNENYGLTFTTLVDRSNDIRTFTSNRVESAIQLNQRLSRANMLQSRVIFRNVSIPAETLRITPEQIPVFAHPVRTVQISSTFIQDRRDDPLDSTRGIHTTADFGIAPPALAARTAFTRLLVRNSTYHRIGRDLVFARTVSFGWLYNLDDRPVPLPERFFGGGATTHRGFPENQAGPRDPLTGFPVGGNALLFLGHELRFPLFGRNLGGAIFHDMGNVYSSLSRMSFRLTQRDLADFDYMTHAIGFGLRYKTPVGPVRIDLAFSPNSPRFFGFEGTREQLARGVGIALLQQRVNRLQFFFSLGQTF
jgi:outer membrane protein assembly complex protein YaeT